MPENKLAPNGAFPVDIAKEAFKESISNMDIMEPKQLDVISKEASKQARKKRVQAVKDSGRTPKKKLSAQDCTDNLVHMLKGATLEETIAFANEGKPEGWFDSVKNDELPSFVRKEVVINLRVGVDTKGDDSLTLLKHMLENDYTSFREIQKIDTHNNQLKKVSKLITMSDRIDTLEDKVSSQGKEIQELREFKRQQELFNSVVVSEISNQRTLVESMVECIVPKFTGTVEQISTLQTQLSLIPSVEDKIIYMINHNIPKKDISGILNIPRRTLYRMIDKLDRN